MSFFFIAESKESQDFKKTILREHFKKTPEHVFALLSNFKVLFNTIDACIKCCYTCFQRFSTLAFPSWSVSFT